MSINRRKFLQTSAAVSIGAGVLGAPAIAQSRTRIKVGYLHTLAVDGQIWTGIDRGSFAKHGVELDLVQFTTGLELFQAMIGGSIEMLVTGAVISNFPARGQGKMFLVNDIEFATAQLWVHSDEIKRFADLKGKKISTTTGTTAHVFLDTALRANDIDPKDVQVVNQRMSEAVTSFISGAVPAVALWVPFNIPVKEKVKDAKMLSDASKYYPQAAIVDGWATRDDYYGKNREACANIIRAWAEANDYMIANADAALEALQKKHYEQVPLADLKEQFTAQKMFTSHDWRKLYADGTVTKWLQQVTDFFVRFGGIQNPVPASRYFDPKLYLDTIKA
ncbi:MAG TPA: ABC transporter substrate-binding protein [Casimicrobiaceae bacterium]|jgi:NitT/TauT family transport system substrate-binding protein|nr:ABC transporter substrate-binding protein [Casimicrobiaceae bacterium]